MNERTVQLMADIERIYQFGPRDGFVQGMLWQTFLAMRALLLPQPAERPSIEAVLDDLQSCVQNIECDCLDPPEDHDPPEDADDYRAHSQYCRRYLFGYIGTLRAALASPPVEPRQRTDQDNHAKMFIRALTIMGARNR